ncbi:AraC family transcriptional regulator [Rhodococcus sp. P1Y]|uniref:AraC family transcriptional regulator n=1 Tax=Rhodococcus sp. P1Y TaxID=1302308 RepID=UPI001F1B15A4|nr:helix-turn-helix domain-containing protein [Rhodococcus sp. P1Y]
MTPRALPKSCCPATLWLWAGRAVYSGPSLELDFHSGSVLCFAAGVDAPFRLHDDRGGVWTVRSAAVAPRTVHRVESTGERMLFAYSDPGTSRADRILDTMAMRIGGIGLTHTAEARILDAVNVDDPDPHALAEFISGPEPRLLDDRIREAMQIVRTKPGAVVAASDLAAAVNLSTSRFLHLFSAETGTSFRRYRLWARMLHVGEAVADGRDLTRASVEAGFASPSHFSDSFHAMFGLSAAALLATGTNIVVIDRDLR